jgi:hypothetical protein
MFPKKKFSPMNTKLRWKAHVKKKGEELDLRYKNNVLVNRKELLAVPP